MAGRRVRAYIGLGANVGDAAATLARAVAALDALPGVAVRGVSRLYVDEPGRRDRPARLPQRGRRPRRPGRSTTPRPPRWTCWSHLKDIERAFGRQTRGRWGPREVDLDLLAVRPGAHPRRAATRGELDRRRRGPGRPRRGCSRSRTARRGDRLFVLAPLSDLAPWLSPPGWGETVDTARRRREAIEGPDAVRPIGTWDPHGAVWRPADATLRP